jgi:hypothetical protein
MTPLVPATVDLRDYEFMPLKVARLRDSDLVTYSTGEEFKAAVLLWCAAWHQVPAGSLPNDDRWLAKHSGAGLAWRKLKPGAMRGWVECDDGRLYHPVIAEVVLSSWDKKQEQRAKTANARIAAIAKRQSQTVIQSVTESQLQKNKATVTDRVTDLGKHLSQANKPSVTMSVTSSKGSKEVLPQVLQTPDITARATAETSTAGEISPLKNNIKGAMATMSREEQVAFAQRNQKA